MMIAFALLAAVSTVLPVEGRATLNKRDTPLLEDINVIKNYWGQVSCSYQV